MSGDAFSPNDGMQPTRRWLPLRVPSGNPLSRPDTYGVGLAVLPLRETSLSLRTREGAELVVSLSLASQVAVALCQAAAWFLTDFELGHSAGLLRWNRGREPIEAYPAHREDLDTELRNIAARTRYAIPDGLRATVEGAWAHDITSAPSGRPVAESELTALLLGFEMQCGRLNRNPVHAITLSGRDGPKVVRFVLRMHVQDAVFLADTMLALLNTAGFEVAPARDQALRCFEVLRPAVQRFEAVLSMDRMDAVGQMTRDLSGELTLSERMDNLAAFLQDRRASEADEDRLVRSSNWFLQESKFIAESLARPGVDGGPPLLPMLRRLHAAQSEGDLP